MSDSGCGVQGSVFSGLSYWNAGVHFTITGQRKGYCQGFRGPGFAFKA